VGGGEGSGKQASKYVESYENSLSDEICVSIFDNGRGYKRGYQLLAVENGALTLLINRNSRIKDALFGLRNSIKH